MARTGRSKGKAAVSPHPEKVPGCYFKKIGGKYLLTNDWGGHAFLKPDEFRRFLAGDLTEDSPLWRELQPEGFIRDYMHFEDLIRQFRKMNAFLSRSPSLHILVVNLRCNHKCLYCHSSAVDSSRTDTDMSSETAKAAIDLVFDSPSEDMVIEFQGGEPLLNWPVVKFAIQYARRKNEQAKRRLMLAVVSNMSLMDGEKLDFFLDNEVSLCTSLDGPEALHNRNRIYKGGDAYAGTVRWIEEVQRRYDGEQTPRRRIFKANALMTTTRFSLPYYREIVDEYARLGLEGIFIRPLSPIGYAKKVWGKIGYTSKEYVEFYRAALDYIIQLNLGGKELMERSAVIILSKVLNKEDPGFVDLRSPCGAAVGQMAYNYDGNVYTCDEGRMVAHQGNDMFKVGNVFESTFSDLINSRAARACVMASNLENQPVCSRCVYRPYCGVCPVYNYEAQQSLWGYMPTSGHCAIHKGIFEFIFEKLSQPEVVSVFRSWLRKRQPDDSPQSREAGQPDPEGKEEDTQSREPREAGATGGSGG